MQLYGFWTHILKHKSVKNIVWAFCFLSEEYAIEHYTDQVIKVEKFKKKLKYKFNTPCFQ